MIPQQPSLVPAHAVPLIAYGLPRQRYGVDHMARRELAEHIAALCLSLHGRDCGDCTTHD